MRLTRWVSHRGVGRFSAPPVLIACLTALVAGAGCAGAAKPLPPKPVVVRVQPTPPPRLEKPWMNARGICVFPLDRDGIPRTGGQLAASMLGGWKNVFKLPNPSAAIDIAGGRYPAVESMTIDLTGAVSDADRKPTPVPDPRPSRKSLSVERFTMVAEPLVSGKAKVNMLVTGRGVRFDVQHDRQGRPLLMLADAREGTLHFDLTHEDLERLLLQQARQQGGRR